MVVFGLFLDGAAQTVTPPDGTWFEAENSPQNVTGGSHGLHVFWHRATGSESGTYGNFTWGSSTYRSGFATRWDNVVASGTPFDSPTGGAQDNANSTTTPAVSTTSLGPDRQDVFYGTNWSGGTWTAPTSFTKQREGTDQVIVLCTHDHPTAGSTGSTTATCTGSDKRTAWIGALIGTTPSTVAVGPVSRPFHPGAGVLNAARFYRSPGSTQVAGTPLVLVDSLADCARPAATTDSLAVGLLLADTASSSRAATAVDVLAVGVTLTDLPTTSRGSPTSDVLAVGVALADAAPDAARSTTVVGETAVPGVLLTDPGAPGGGRGAGTLETLSVGIALSDLSTAARAAGTVEVLAAGVVLTDLAGGGRAGGTFGETVSSATVLTDPAPASARGGALVETLAIGLLLADAPSGGRGAATTDTLAAGLLLTDLAGGGRAATVAGETVSSATVLTDPTTGGSRAGVRGETLAVGVALADQPAAARNAVAADVLAAGLALTDGATGTRAGTLLGEMVSSATVLTDPTVTAARSSTTSAVLAAGMVLADPGDAARAASSHDTLTGTGQWFPWPPSAGAPIVIPTYQGGQPIAVQRYTGGAPYVV